MLQIEVVPLSRIRAAATNSRTHSAEQVAQIARSISEFGFTNPILIDESGEIIAGHGRVAAAESLGLQDVPAVVLRGLTEEQRRAYCIADNQLALNAGWDLSQLRAEVEWLQAEEFDIDVLGFDDSFLDTLLADILPPQTDPDACQEPSAEPVSKPGDVWLCGPHRVMCGDSTSVDNVEKLMAGKKAQLIHADPPYGMGKESDGVVNDNLRESELDSFQMEWWATYRTFLIDKASAYIWGNAPDLWRLWYVGGLGDSEVFELRNAIVWDKKSIAGMASSELTKYPIASEHCLFFQFGSQFLDNVNAEDFPAEWAPLQNYMAVQGAMAGVKPADVKRVCGVGMYSHWFTKSQFQLIPAEHYAALRAEYAPAFPRPWPELKAEWDAVKSGPQQRFAETRSYFDNAHDVMRDVWEHAPVNGDERHGHATPKPAALMERVMRSSLPPGGLCVEPFGGSGSTLIGAEQTGRVCYTMEITPAYVDVIVRRWQALTGKKAFLESTGAPFESV